MADEIDMANELAELALTHALRNIAAAPRLPPKGFCYYCDAPVEGAQLFCDKDCANDHEKEQKIKNRR
jgi:hypothetical protein